MTPLERYSCDFNFRHNCGHAWRVVYYDQVTPSVNVGFLSVEFGSRLVYIKDTDDDRFCWGWGQYFRVRDMLSAWMMARGYEWNTGVRKICS